MSNTNNFDSFISYDRDDYEDIHYIVEQLQYRGQLRVFIDSQIKPGENWLSIIANNILQCETFLLFIRKPPKRWQLDELNIAIKHHVESGKPYIIPVILPHAEKTAFHENPNLAFIAKSQAAEFGDSVKEVDVINSIINAVIGESKVYINSRAMPRKDRLPSGFKADLGRLTELLIGESVYTSSTICVRELVQNARDACTRHYANQRPEHRPPEIIINIDSRNRYFDVIDFGDGMTSNTISDSFSVLGKSFNDSFHEENKNRQAVSSPVTGKFGVGFITTFMLADRIVISTKSISEKAYHFSMHSPKLPFEYSNESTCDRKFNDCGTTVRVYLKPEYAYGVKGLNIASLVAEYCRHVPDLYVFKDNRKVPVESDWNLPKDIEIITCIKTEKYEITLTWGSNLYDTLKLSNGGFFVTDLGKEVLGDFPRGLIAGEINRVRLF